MRHDLPLRAPIGAALPESTLAALGGLTSKSPKASLRSATLDFTAALGGRMSFDLLAPCAAALLVVTDHDQCGEVTQAWTSQVQINHSARVPGAGGLTNPSLLGVDPAVIACGCGRRQSDTWQARVATEKHMGRCPKCAQALQVEVCRAPAPAVPVRPGKVAGSSMTAALPQVLGLFRLAPKVAAAALAEAGLDPDSAAGKAQAAYAAAGVTALPWDKVLAVHGAQRRDAAPTLQLGLPGLVGLVAVPVAAVTAVASRNVGDWKVADGALGWGSAHLACFNPAWRQGGRGPQSSGLVL